MFIFNRYYLGGARTYMDYDPYDIVLEVLDECLDDELHLMLYAPQVLSPFQT